MGLFDYDVDDVLEQLEGIARRVPDAVPDAVDAMSDILVENLKDAAPYDENNKDGDHLKDVIGKTRLKKSKKGNPYRVVTITKRGEKDKNVYKAVVAEHGRKDKSPVDATHFWSKTERSSEDAMYEAAKEVMEKAIYGN